MDSVAYFKRKGLYKDRRTDAVFPNNPARALYFARAALHCQKLGWGPDVVHASGWIAALTRTSSRASSATTNSSAPPGLSSRRCVEGFEPTISAEEAAALGLPESMAGMSLREIGLTQPTASHTPLATRRKRPRRPGPRGGAERCRRSRLRSLLVSRTRRQGRIAPSCSCSASRPHGRVRGRARRGEHEVADFALVRPRQHGARLAGLISAALGVAASRQRPSTGSPSPPVRARTPGCGSA